MNRLEKALVLGALLLGAPGCTTDGFCFADCTPPNITTGDGGPVSPYDSGGPIFTDGACHGFQCLQKDGSQPSTCVPTNNGVEICDGIDNDCDGQIDEPGTPPDGIDFTDPVNCGDCQTDCRNLTVETAVCVPPTNLGKEPGTCDYQGCKLNQYDLDGDRSNGCEHTCPYNPDRSVTIDVGPCNIDDDCDGKIDEDIDTCRDADNCGVCGNKCTFPHAVAVECRPDTGVTKDCTASNAHCVATQCEAGWIDHPIFGPCGYQCTPSNNGVEVCDGVDNDCDGKIDNADADMETSDPTVGQPCSGGADGLCADPSHQGISKCIGASVTCCDVDSNNVQGTNRNFPPTGVRNGICKGTTLPFVLHPNEVQETCNNVDDDCNGVVDDDTVDSGTPCGKSVGTCRPGTMQCLAGGTSTCVGETPPMVDPTTKLPIDPCDGLDNDCDGVIDGTKPANATPCTTEADCTAPNSLCLPLSADPNDKGCVRAPSDVGDPTTGAPVACDVPLPPPAGVTTPCRAGIGACFGGVFVCQGSIKATAGVVDRCNEDTNCDGVLTDQTGPSKNDVKNCGSCGNDCTALGPNGAWSCVNGVCTRNGCQPGFIECGGSSPDDCETACAFQSSTESCNGLDDNCNCQVDEEPPPIVRPSPVQACGVNASATDPGCSSKVALACTNGGWKCTFTDPAYCSAGTCPTTPDLCDGKDNNCDGQTDEPFKPPALVVGFLGQACFSDDGKPAPGDGPCRTQGTFVCKSDGTDTQCSATKDMSKATAELCDGIDNNCNGTVDDGLTADTRIGKQCFGGTQGICALAAHAGTTTCQTGAVVCSGSNLVHPGEQVEICNGLDDDCDGVVDNNLTDVGGKCGSGVGQCKTGTTQCVSGKPSCVGAVGPQPEICDGLDNNCNGQIDDSPTDVGTACNVPPPPPTGVPQPCKGGIYACVGATRVCQGSIPPTQTTDNCNEDTNCDGKLTDQTGLKNSDILNCGSCGHNCNSLDPNSVWACQSGTCVRTGCKSGFINCDANANDCERACTFRSSTESCNGLDDDCNCQIDDNVPPATPVQVCGVSPAATDVGCTTGVTRACVSGAWKCTFPAGYCTGGNCSTMVDSCDGKDNNCSGVADENFKAPVLSTGYLGQSCTSDQGKPPPGDGPCQTTGTFVCNGAGTGTQCTATKDTSKAKAETCNGIDDDCNGVIDDNITAANDPRVGQQCFGGTQGLCAAPAHAGATACVGGAIVCQGANLLKPGQQAETCNGVDDDCNGTIDNNPTDVGGVCGSGVGACQTGTYACVSGSKVCQGNVTAKPEKCNGIDDDCDGTTDNNLTDVGGDCNVPPAAPPATAQCPVVTEFCKKGTLACSAGVLVCQGSTIAQSTTDGCCVDSNCDGALTNQPDFQTDVKNCGSCGNDCTTKGGHVIWGCSAGACVKTGCAFGFIDCDANTNDCERACTPSGAELCNNADDNCNCQIDEGVSVPAPSQVCGVSPAAQSVDSKCGPGDGTTGVKVSCVSGGWQCTFPAGYCNLGTPPACSTTADNCDNEDNNCNGVLDDNYNKPILTQGYVGQPCASDDGKPPPGDGACRTTGVFQCNGTTATKCNATKDLTKAGPELCDGADNDCDGSVDEPFNKKGTNATYFVKPAVVKVGSFWMYEFEASRPNATTLSPGSGNGYYCTGAGCTNVPTAPSGVTLDKTPACSVSGKIPWFNVTPVEVEQTCQAMGGTICSTPNWITACQGGSSCRWGYYSNCSTSPATLTAPDGTVYYDTTKTPYCNLGLFDFDGTAGAPNRDGLLVSKSGALKGCLANYGLDASNNPFGLFDITGNLREITKRATNDYPLMGGAFNTQSDGGAECDFDFYSVSTTFKLYDAGFRCCFAADPTL